MSTILDKIASLGLTLPAVPAPVAAYVNCVRSGNLLFLSGGLPIDGDKKVIGKVDIENIVSKIARIPPQSVSNDDRSKLATLDRDLKTVVFGQDNAI